MGPSVVNRKWQVAVRWCVVFVAVCVAGYRSSADEAVDDGWTVHASLSRHPPVAGERGPGRIYFGATVGWTGEPSADERDRPRWFTAMPPAGSRWTSVVVGVSGRPPPIGLVASSGHVVDRLGLRMVDGSASTEFGGPGGDVRQTTSVAGPDAGDRALGLAGTVTTFAGRPAIERVEMLFEPTPDG